VVRAPQANQLRDERGLVIESLVERSGTKEINYQLLRSITPRGSERVVEGYAQGQFLSLALGRVGQPFKQVQSFLTVVNYFAICTAPQRGLSRSTVVLHRPEIIPCSSKMRCEFRGNLAARSP
jgi:hypothetical protein